MWLECIQNAQLLRNQLTKFKCSYDRTLPDYLSLRMPQSIVKLSINTLAMISELDMLFKLSKKDLLD